MACRKSSDNYQIIHVHVSDVVIYEENIQITLRFAKTDHLSKSAKLLRYQSQDTHIWPVSLTKQFFSSQTKMSRPLFCHFDGHPDTRYQFSNILAKVVEFIGSPVPPSNQLSFFSELKLPRWLPLSV